MARRQQGSKMQVGGWGAVSGGRQKRLRGPFPWHSLPKAHRNLDEPALPEGYHVMKTRSKHKYTNRNNHINQNPILNLNIETSYTNWRSSTASQKCWRCNASKRLIMWEGFLTSSGRSFHHLKANTGKNLKHTLGKLPALKMGVFMASLQEGA